MELGFVQWELFVALTVKIATAISTEILGKLQYTTWLGHNGQRLTLDAKPMDKNPNTYLLFYVEPYVISNFLWSNPENRNIYIFKFDYSE